MASHALAFGAAIDAKTAGPGGVCHPMDSEGRIRAVLFDLDGTLYNQRRLRLFMALEVAVRLVLNPFSVWRELKVVRAYRHALEALRSADLAGPLTPDHQLLAAARETGVTLDDAKSIVAKWMVVRPLKYLRWCEAPELDELLTFLANRGVPAGVFSDYPVTAKLDALGVSDRLSPRLCATDREVGALKPHPRGFLHACKLWRLPSHEVLMVGDRPELDAAGAAAAGMPCVIIGRRSQGPLPPQTLVLPSFERLRHVLDDCR